MYFSFTTDTLNNQYCYCNTYMLLDVKGTCRTHFHQLQCCNIVFLLQVEHTVVLYLHVSTLHIRHTYPTTMQTNSERAASILPVNISQQGSCVLRDCFQQKRLVPLVSTLVWLGRQWLLVLLNLFSWQVVSGSSTSIHTCDTISCWQRTKSFF